MQKTKTISIKLFSLSIISLILMTSCATVKSISAKIEKVQVSYKGKEVTARKLIISSAIPMAIDAAWENVQTSKLLEFVASGKVKFKPTEGYFPQRWREGDTVNTKMLFYGFLPFGGIHSLYFEKIDGQNKVLQTREWDKSAKIWDHKISLKYVDDTYIIYEDEVIIYGGILTGFIAKWAKSFYKHRQKRWQILAGVSNEL